MAANQGETIPPNGHMNVTVSLVVQEKRIKDIFVSDIEGPNNSMGILMFVVCIYYSIIYDDSDKYSFSLHAVTQKRGAFGSPIHLEEVPLAKSQILVRKIVTNQVSALGVDPRESTKEN